MRNCFILALCVLLFNGCTYFSSAADNEGINSVLQAEDRPNVGPLTPQQVAYDLNLVGRKLIDRASKTIMPSRNSMQVSRVPTGYVATYIEIDKNSMNTEMLPGTTGNYIGMVRYYEHIYECHGRTKQEALNANCSEVKMRRINEMLSHDGSHWLF